MTLDSIKYIVTVGTSFTHGGGYAEGTDTIKILNKYENNIPSTQEECSWPAFLKKLIKSEIKIYNLALPGTGIEYLIRTTNEWIIKNENKVKDTLFLLENSGYGRIELWDNDVERYIVCNWDYGVRKDNFCVSLHNGISWRNSKKLNDKIGSGEIQVEKFLDRYCSPMLLIENLQSQFFDFLCKLKYHNINFKIFGEPFYDERFQNDNIVKCNRLYLKDNKNIQHCGIYQFIEANKVQIKNITNGEVNDDHACLEGNRQIAEQYYNQLKELYKL